MFYLRESVPKSLHPTSTLSHSPISLVSVTSLSWPLGNIFSYCIHSLCIFFVPAKVGCSQFITCLLFLPSGLSCAGLPPASFLYLAISYHHFSLAQLCPTAFPVKPSPLLLPSHLSLPPSLNNRVPAGASRSLPNMSHLCCYFYFFPHK